ncbi:MAG: oligosaccharide flippase family protein [Bacteroidales bacterium]|nr:oligosaccharide flippase family protein [Bacteroidales bacterium]
MFKKLAGQTLVYGLGTIVPRFLNYIILTPYFTRLFSNNQAEYGKVTELYAFIAFLMIVLTYGMETTFFRYVNEKKHKQKVFSTILTSLLFTSVAFFTAILILRKKIAEILEYNGEEIFIVLLGGILAVEAMSAIPFAKIRIEERVKKFATLKIVQVVLNIAVMLIIYNVIPLFLDKSGYLLNSHGEISARYIFIANLFSASFVLILLIPEIKQFKIKMIDLKLMGPYLAYGLPLLITGLAGTINETLDRTIYKHIIEDHTLALYELGIYGANYKLGAVILIFIQMYRYSVEPFFFNTAGEKESREKYAKLLNMFTGITVGMGLLVLVFLDYFKYFIDRSYHEGLFVVPYIIMAYILYGILFNLSVWFKLSNKTRYGIIIMATGAIITLIINIWYIPQYGYKASAVAHVISYSVMVIISYILGQRHYKIRYNVLRIIIYIGMGCLIYYVSRIVDIENDIMKIIFKTILLLIFFTFVNWRERLFMIIRKY